MVIVSLLFSLAVGLATSIANSFSIRQQINWIAVVFGGIGVITAISTYYMIIKKLRASRKHLQTSVHNPRSKVKKEFMVPAVLISTYIILYAIPSLIINFYPWSWQGEDEVNLKLFSTGYCICLVIPQIGAIVDAFTFTILSKHYRDTIINLLRNNSQVTAPNNIS